jgi:hypothetical protein
MNSKAILLVTAVFSTALSVTATADSFYSIQRRPGRNGPRWEYAAWVRCVDEYHRELLLACPTIVSRHPSSVLGEVHGLIRRRDGVARGSTPQGNQGQTIEMLVRALMHPTSRNLCRYWQDNKPEDYDFVWTG